MGGRFRRTYGTYLAAAYFLLALGLLGLGDGARLAGQKAFMPITETASGAGEFTLRSIAVWQNAGRLAEERADLLSRLAASQAEVGRLRGLEAENASLRRELGLPVHREFRLVPGEVISPGGDRLFRVVTIDRGTVDGLRDGMAVVREGTLVGTVVKVSDSTAEVRLLTDPRSDVPVVVQGTSVSGAARAGGEDTLALAMVPSSESVTPGSLVVTSGLGETFPRGILVGKVDTVISRPTDLFQEIALTSALDLENLERVFVILGRR